MYKTHSVSRIRFHCAGSVEKGIKRTANNTFNPQSPNGTTPSDRVGTKLREQIWQLMETLIIFYDFLVTFTFCSLFLRGPGRGIPSGIPLIPTIPLTIPYNITTTNGLGITPSWASEWIPRWWSGWFRRCSPIDIGLGAVHHPRRNCIVSGRKIGYSNVLFSFGPVSFSTRSATSLRAGWQCDSGH